VHQDFATAKVDFGAMVVDFASTREESYPKKGGLPQVENVGCELIKDVKRRDFTINALAMSLNRENMFEIVDYVNAQNDLRAKVLRILHPQSFIDDPTRIIRGLEFSLRFDFHFDEQTQILARQSLENPDRSTLSKERVRLSLKRLFSLNLAKAYDRLVEEKIYKIFIDNLPFELTGERIFNAVKLFEVNEPWKVYYDALFTLCEKRNAKTNLEIFNTFKGLQNAELAHYWAITDDGNALKYFEKLKDVRLKITGGSLLEAGVPQSRLIGELLEKTFAQKLEGKLFSCDEELKFALQLYESMKKI